MTAKRPNHFPARPPRAAAHCCVGMRSLPAVLVSLAASVALGAAEADCPASARRVTAFVTGGADNPVCDVRAAEVPGGAAFGCYDETVEQVGWGHLRVWTADAARALASRGGRADGGGSWTTLQKAFAAGCVQAALTQRRMYEYWYNYAQNEYGPTGPSKELLTFMATQEAWVRGEVAANAGSSDPYWVGLAHILAQFDGLVNAYTQSAPASEAMDALTIYMLNSVGDLEDLNGLFPNAKVAASLRGSAGASDAAEAVNPLAYRPMPLKDKLTDCSGFVKVLPDGSDIVVGHTTWRGFYAMLRVYSEYEFDFWPASVVSLSSSPGFLHSKDDFYVSGGAARLAVFETTNSVFNQTLYQLYITPKSVLTWQRVMVAMGWATSGSQWTSLFARYNSGTYNNQWVVVDAKLFQPASPAAASSAAPLSLPANLLWILEQIPGTTVASDVTSVLGAQTYWPSYNIPYTPSIYNVSGYPAKFNAYGNDYSYGSCKRAQIFRRNQTTVASVQDAQNLMVYNNFQTDPLANKDPILGSIAARGDLRTPTGVAFGGVDAKVVSVADLGRGTITVQAYSGPTHAQQTPFAFAPKFSAIPHIGVPEVFDFPWVQYQIPA